MVRLMYRSFTVVAAALLLAAVVVVDASRAQDAQKQLSLTPALLQGGEYRDLNWYRRMKLGSAYFVNPGLVKQAAVAYKYPVELLDEADVQWQAKMLMMKGGLAVGKISEDGHIVLHWGQDSRTLEEIVTVFEEAMWGGAVLVTSKQTLGSIEGKPIVSWEPQGPLLHVGNPPAE